ncbi:PfkB family carbohydrate kinase [Rhizobium sp. 32-5/1]|uniref:PfkB family carbohydrate kinase n=1 Tax=Rhizobium sp. 32-5/1 TaxID=3019602 RepID=UPI00240E28CC|nr:PfkB family carbohydrate kinase [Rhizobium sp. 32-5/1]WEZ85031.1 PfkB family carbohydrate kinase [Rhizobium sp. 32-5/1]
MFNASPLASGVQPQLNNVDFVIVNEGEAQAISGTRQPADAAARVRDLGAGCVIVTLGPRGCLLLGSGCAEPSISRHRTLPPSIPAGRVMCCAASLPDALPRE